MRHFLSATDTKKNEEATNDIFARAQSALPSCYTPEFDRCFDEAPGASKFPHCDVMNQAYDADYDRMQAIIDDVPLCEPPDRGAELVKLLLAAVVGAGLGFLIPRPRK